MKKLKEIMLYLLIGILLNGLLWVVFILSYNSLTNRIFVGIPLDVKVLLITLYPIPFLFIGIFILKKVFKQCNTRNSFFSFKCSLSTLFIHTCTFVFMYYLYTNRDWGIGILGVDVGLSILLAIVFEIVWVIIDRIKSKRKSD